MHRFLRGDRNGAFGFLREVFRSTKKSGPQVTPQMITLQLDVVYCIAAAILWPVLTGVIMWCFNPTKHMFKKATDMEVESTEIACQTDHDKDYVHHV